MSELEEKLGAVLNNPQLMQQIMSMAQSLGASQNTVSEEVKKPEAPSTQLPNLDPRMLQSLAGIARQGGVDTNQQALLAALSPYLSQERVGKLERAMKAARMAGAASVFLNSGGLQMLTGG
jgi:hypothetical protein